MMNTNDRIFGLDLLRALAIFFVVYGHSLHLLPNDAPKQVLYFFVLDGVSIFFVLSGFLIGRILLRTISHEHLNSQMLLNFWARRWWRTLPSYYLVLALLILLNLSLNDNTPPIPDNISSYFLFIQNLAWPHPEFFGEAWSLAVEEWFYLCLPLPLYFARRFFRIEIGTLTIGCVTIVVIASILYRSYLASTIGFASELDWSYGLRMQVTTRMDSLMFGVLGAYLSLFQRDRWMKLSSACAISAGVSLIIFDKVMHATGASRLYVNYFSLSIAPLGTLLLLPALSGWQCKPNPITRLIAFTSVTSYSMYLVNEGLVLETIIPAIMPRLGPYFWRLSDHFYVITFLSFWTLTLLISFILYRYYEIPMTNFRNRWGFSAKETIVGFEVVTKKP